MKQVYLISTYDQQLAIVSNVKAAYRVCLDYILSAPDINVPVSMIRYNSLLAKIKNNNYVDMESIHDLNVRKFNLLVK